jgi:hypothetical protein
MLWRSICFQGPAGETPPGQPAGRRRYFFGRQSDDSRGDLLLQSLETRVHKGLLTFSVLSVRMLRDK